MEKIKELTKVELQLMNLLWDKQQGFVNDILAELPDPKPAYNTVSTFMRILVTKGFVGYEASGKSHRYYPLITREAYMESFMSGVKNAFFSGSFRSMISYFAKKEHLSNSEIENIMKILDENKK
ncbi:MAG: BlaI/MecI/CopY family transcriptional regulator [Bacteroidales bacterium]|nr:BlaI/MecI/CopY family transcriptional regulator [Bacteroidales bacterium]